MSKQIIVESCGECPYVAMRMRGYFCEHEMSMSHKCESDEIHKDCPLQERAGREEAEKIIFEDYMTLQCPQCDAGILSDRNIEGMSELLDKLGFGKEGK
jgi:hypothetical protein